MIFGCITQLTVVNKIITGYQKEGARASQLQTGHFLFAFINAHHLVVGFNNMYNLSKWQEINLWWNLWVCQETWLKLATIVPTWSGMMLNCKLVTCFYWQSESVTGVCSIQFRASIAEKDSQVLITSACLAIMQGHTWHYTLHIHVHSLCIENTFNANYDVIQSFTQCVSTNTLVFLG